MIKSRNDRLYNFSNNSTSVDSIETNLGLFESSEPAESNRSIFVEIGLVVVELFTFQFHHGKSDIYG